MSGTLTRVTTSEATLPPSSPAERSEGKGIQGPRDRPRRNRSTHSAVWKGWIAPPLDPLPSAFGLAGGDG